MLGISFEADWKPCEKKLDRMIGKLKNKRPFFKTFADSIRNRAVLNARSMGGRRFWGDRVAKTVQCAFDNGMARVWTDAPEAIHKEFGGPIRARLKNFLTIPVDRSVRGKSVDQIKTGKKVFRFKSKKGNKLIGTFRGRGKKKELVALFLLLKQTRPQRKFPWWVTPAKARELATASADFWLEKGKE